MSFGNYYIDCLVRIGCSFICGLLLGIERKTRQHPVGLRTLILISVSSTLLSIFSVFIANNPQFPGDPTRVAAGVVTGIGFLGGGAILHQGLNIKGLTSAAVIWTAAALGLACGTGQFFIVGITLFVALFALVVLEKIEY
ncbi:MAG: MgtC/SapB family protein, partial [Treponema sp.]|nr:MgtC/SapB family protein [Treponema sp.]